jgi:hypothetical protein
MKWTTTFVDYRLLLVFEEIFVCCSHSQEHVFALCHIFEVFISSVYNYFIMHSVYEIQI